MFYWGVREAENKSWLFLQKEVPPLFSFLPAAVCTLDSTGRCLLQLFTSEPESVMMGWVAWKCIRRACLHCGVFCKCLLMTDLILILHFSCAYFNPTKAASLHVASLLFLETHRNICSYVNVVLVLPWSCDSELNKRCLVLSDFTFL